MSGNFQVVDVFMLYVACCIARPVDALARAMFPESRVGIMTTACVPRVFRSVCCLRCSVRLRRDPHLIGARPLTAKGNCLVITIIRE